MYKIKRFNEGIKWYSKGKFIKDDTEPDIDDNITFHVGDIVSFDYIYYWNDGGRGSFKEGHKWTKYDAGYEDKEITNVGYSMDRLGYTGQILKFKDMWCWAQTTGVKIK